MFSIFHIHDKHFTNNTQTCMHLYVGILTHNWILVWCCQSTSTSFQFVTFASCFDHSPSNI